MGIICINVVLSGDGREIMYFIQCENGTTERYTEQNVPHSIIKMINCRVPAIVTETATHKTFYYRVV